MNVSARSGTHLAVALVSSAVLLAACGRGSSAHAPSDESILAVSIPGTSDASVSQGADGSTTKLFSVVGDWNQVSVDLATIARSEGWTIVKLNCVGSGNDVIAKKRVKGEWLLLESGAGTRGAGIIVRPDPDRAPPEALSVTGQCPTALVAAAS